MHGFRERLCNSGYTRASTLDAAVGALDDAAAPAAELGYQPGGIDHAALCIFTLVEMQVGLAAWE